LKKLLSFNLSKLYFLLVHLGERTPLHHYYLGRKISLRFSRLHHWRYCKLNYEVMEQE